jgi:hypothetical protein
MRRVTKLNTCDNAIWFEVDGGMVCVGANGRLMRRTDSQDVQCIITALQNLARDGLWEQL